jgi:hypothetical protein
MKILLIVSIALLTLPGCTTAPAAPAAAPAPLPDWVVTRALENQKRVNQLRMGQTLAEVERVMGGGPERRHARVRFDGVAIEEWSYSTDPQRKLDTVITFVGGKVEEINTASWERRSKEADPRETPQASIESPTVMTTFPRARPDSR